ncbi:transposase [Loktanella sp. DSM 29012]|uniref:transposase n=1 Tax=Loktanella sp. DSM 29012 TaxID=1881056 RepID=UPI000B7F2759|nr:transposase [Loktanella sp. DSM 29012]
MTAHPFPDRTAELIHWTSLFLGLPHGGIDAAFPSEKACEARLYDVRWPEGAVCPACSQTDVHFLDVRKLFVCRNCKTHFSLTSGTDLHGSHKGLKFNFEVAADFIQHLQMRRMPSLRQLQGRHGVAYATAVKLRARLMTNLTKPHGGLLGHCICVDLPDIPPDVATGSEAHLRHLEAEVQRRRWRALGIE